MRLHFGKQAYLRPHANPRSHPQPARIRSIHAVQRPLPASARADLDPTGPAGFAELRRSLSPGANSFIRGEPGYEAARVNEERTWNKDILTGRYPAAICIPATPEDVCSIVKYAAARRMALCIACGRHSPYFLQDGALLIDLCRMSGVQVDAERRVAVVEGGALLGSVDAACAPHGLGVTFGHVPHTGVGGLTQHGGHGHLERLLGLTVDSLLSVDVVLADGTLVTATPDDTNQYRDLFWGIAGGSGNFGVVVKFTFKLHVLANKGIFYGGPRVYITPLAPLLSPPRAAVLDHWAALSRVAPNEFSGVFFMECGGITVEFGMWAGEDQAVGRRYLADNLITWHWAGLPLFWPRSYFTDLQSLTKVPHGYYYIKNVLVQDLGPELIEILDRKTTKDFPNRNCSVSIQLLGGKGGERDVEETAVATRKLLHWIIITGTWDGTAADAADQRAKVVAWARDMEERCARFAVGRYGALSEASVSSPGLNGHLSPAFSASAPAKQHQELKAAPKGARGEGWKGQEGVETHSFGANYLRLQQLKKKYDPTNLFRSNENVVPAA